VALVCDLTDQRLKTNGASKAPFVLSEAGVSGILCKRVEV